MRASIEEPNVDYAKWTRAFEIGDGSGFEYLFVGVTLCGAFLWRVHTTSGDSPSDTDVDC